MRRFIRVVRLVLDYDDVMIALLELRGHTEHMGALEGGPALLRTSAKLLDWPVFCAVVLHGGRGCIVVGGYFIC